MSERLATVLLLRHAEIRSHRGDVPVTEEGRVAAVRAGAAIGQAVEAPITLLYGGTRRTRETAEALAAGLADPARVLGPVDCFALRNPDVYVCGVRVDMVSSVDALAEQVTGMTDDDAAANEFFAEFISHPDRIGWWLSHQAPPGETAASLADRIEAFVRSVADPGPQRRRLVVGVSHSPVLRAMARRGGCADGEPDYVTGLRVALLPDHSLEISPYQPLTDRGRKTTPCRS